MQKYNNGLMIFKLKFYHNYKNKVKQSQIEFMRYNLLRQMIDSRFEDSEPLESQEQDEQDLSTILTLRDFQKKNNNKYLKTSPSKEIKCFKHCQLINLNKTNCQNIQ